MKTLLRKHRWVKRLMIVLAAAPLFQLSQCQSGVGQVFATTANNLPSTYFQVLNSLALLPIQLLLFGTTGGLGGNGGLGGVGNGGNGF